MSDVNSFMGEGMPNSLVSYSRLIMYQCSMAKGRCVKYRLLLKMKERDKKSLKPIAIVLP